MQGQDLRLTLLTDHDCDDSCENRMQVAKRKRAARERECSAAELTE
jgi:hypothetical protein